MSDSPQTPNKQAQTPNQLKAEASRFLLSTRSPLTRSRVVTVLVVLGSVALASMIVVFATAGPHEKHGQAAAMRHDFQPQPPGILTQPIGDYLSMEKPPKAQTPPPAPIPTRPEPTNVSQGVPSYNSYNEAPPNTSVQFANPNQPPAIQTAPTPRGPLISFPGGPSSDNQQTLAQAAAQRARDAPILYANSVAQTPPPQNAKPQANRGNGPYDTDYQKQNGQKEKNAFLASQQADYGAILDNKYLTPPDPTHELVATTVIPITMITGINSDNPGAIIAQVNHNVYDSLTGTNILIPAGSKLLGTYDSSVAFGQDSVLVAWNRLILPNLVSIELRGMPGADQQGQAGFRDKVNYHITKLLAGVSLATVFNVAQDVALSALSTASFLNSIASAAIANGQVSQSAQNETQQIVEAYANKLINQQPTVTIRPGYQGVVIVNKDIILPVYAPANPYGLPGGSP